MVRQAASIIVPLTLCVLVVAGGCTTATPAGCADGCPDGQICEGTECVNDPSRTTSSSSGGGLVYCESDEECGPEQYCEVAVNACFSIHDCDTAADCQNGQECQDFNNDGARECGFPGCNSVAECGDMECGAGTRLACVARECVCQSPCVGECPGTQLCCGTSEMCIDDPGPCASLTCDPGFEAVGMGGAWSVDACGYEGASCMCQELPPLPLGDVGNPSAIEVDGMGRLWVAGYNRTYGDVMLGQRDGTTGEIAWTFVDGVPAAGMVTGGPSGPRGGVGDEGADVGFYLDLAVTQSGVAHLVYQDRDARTLKYARVDGETITRVTLDLQGETGVYPSIALAPGTAAPRIAWLSRRDDSGAMPTARLKLAAATTASPAVAWDFVVHVLKEEDLSRVPCEGGCPDGEKCEDRPDPELDVCVTEASSCTPSCAATGGEFCSPTGCRLLVAGSNNRNIPEGPGIWSSMVMRPDGKPVVVVYNSFTSSLVAYTTASGQMLEDPTAQFDEVVLAGAMDDAGHWPSVAVESGGTVHVAYINGTTRALMHATLGASLQVVSEAVVDDASRTNGMASDLHRLAEPSLVVRSDGVPVVAYQNSTTGELILATQMGGTWSRQTLAGGGTGISYDGFYGFSTDAVAQGQNAPIVSTYKFNVDEGQESGLVFFNVP